MSDRVARWLIREAGAAAGLLGWDTGPPGACRVAEAAGFAGYLARGGGGLVRDRGAVLMQRLREDVLAEAARELSAALDQAGVRHCFVKGAALLGRVYEPGDREMLDLDLLLHPADVPPALRALRRLGYRQPPEAVHAAARGMRRGMDFERRQATPGADPVRVDAVWAVAPVNRLLSRADTEALLPLWDRLDTAGPVPAPSPAHHLALITHHLAHHDLLHVRGLLDAALLWGMLGEREARRLAPMVRRLRVRRLSAALGRLLHDAVGIPVDPPARPRGPRARPLEGLLAPARWLAWAVGSDPPTHLALTNARIRRRVLLVDGPGDVLRLGRDLVLPPVPYLRWRWPEAPSAFAAWRTHLRRVAGKAMGGDPA